jgi:hypothetical protein
MRLVISAKSKILNPKSPMPMPGFMVPFHAPSRKGALHEWELFDLENDPEERTNLYHQAQSQRIIEGLKQELERLRKDLKDEGAWGSSRAMGSYPYY